MSFFKKLYLKHTYGMDESQDGSNHVVTLPTIVNDSPSLKLVSRAYGLYEMGIEETSNNSSSWIDKFHVVAGSMPGDPWCMAFVMYCLRKASTPFFNANKHLVSASTQIAYILAEKEKLTITDNSQVKIGDVIIFQNLSDKWRGHAGVVVEVKMDEVITVEGNYQDKVSLVKRSLINPPKGQRIRGFIRYFKD